MDSRRRGRAKMSPFSQPQLSNIFFRFLLLLYTSLKCCFNWHIEKKLSIIWAPAPVSCQMSKFSSLQFRVHYFYSVSLILKRSLSLFSFLSASLAVFSISWSLPLCSGYSPLIACVLSPFLFPLCLLICISLLSPPLLTCLLWTALCLALTSKLLYVTSLLRYEYRNQTVLIHCAWESTDSNQKAVRFSTHKKQTKT